MFTAGKLVDNAVGMPGMRRRRGADPGPSVAGPVHKPGILLLNATGY